jgi:hypothetical protein
VKNYIHARLGKNDRVVLEALKTSTGQSESELIRRGLKLVASELARERSALAAAGTSVGRFARGPRDLATNAKHLADFGK